MLVNAAMAGSMLVNARFLDALGTRCYMSIRFGHFCHYFRSFSNSSTVLKSSIDSGLLPQSLLL